MGYAKMSLVAGESSFCSKGMSNKDFIEVLLHRRSRVDFPKQMQILDEPKNMLSICL
jgi:hypothetical protein